MTEVRLARLFEATARALLTIYASQVDGTVFVGGGYDCEHLTTVVYTFTFG